MTKVVISWTGDRGKVLGAACHKALTQAADDLGVAIVCGFSPITTPAGERWRRELRTMLHDADFGVFFIEPAALSSPWVAYEAGFLDGRQEIDVAPPVVHPLVFSTDTSSTASTPFDSLQCVVPTREHIEAFCRTVLTHANGGEAAREQQVETLTEALYRPLEETWSRIRKSEADTRDGLRRALVAVIDSYEHFGLVAPSLAGDLKNLLTVLRSDLPQSRKETSVAFELGEIARFFAGFADSARSTNADDAEFSALATDWALNHLILYAHEQLADIAGGRLPVKNRTPVRQFWQHHVFGRAQSEVWTTNVGKPGDTMGSTETDNLLQAQAAALDRGVKVTRVFVFDPDMPGEEAHDRRMLMRRQLETGIDVRVISKANFGARADSEDAKRNIGSTDFMIIDGAHVYLTYPATNDEISAEYVNGSRHSRVLDSALAFRDVIDHWAIGVNKQNVDDFPTLRPGRIDARDGLEAP